MDRITSKGAIKVSSYVSGAFGFGMLCATQEFFNAYKMNFDGESNTHLKTMMQGMGVANLGTYMAGMAVLKSGDSKLMGIFNFFSALALAIQMGDFLARERDIMVAAGAEETNMMATVGLFSFLCIMHIIGWRKSGVGVPRISMPDVTSSDPTKRAALYSLMICAIFGPTMLFAAPEMMKSYKMEDAFNATSTAVAISICRQWGAQLLYNAFCSYVILQHASHAIIARAVRANWIFFAINIGLTAGQTTLIQHLGRDDMPMKFNQFLWTLGFILSTMSVVAASKGKTKASPKKAAKKSPKKSPKRTPKRGRSKSPGRRRSSRK